MGSLAADESRAAGTNPSRKREPAASENGPRGRTSKLPVAAVFSSDISRPHRARIQPQPGSVHHSRGAGNPALSGRFRPPFPRRG
jgi:hypothetical protein